MPTNPPPVPFERRTRKDRAGAFAACSRRTGFVSRDLSQGRLARFLEKSDRLFAGDARIVLQKLFQWLAALEVVEEDAHGNTCTDEHRGPAENVGVRVNDFSQRHSVLSIRSHG